MKQGILGLYILVLISALISCSTVKKSTASTDKYKWIVQKVDSGNYKIEVDIAYPLSGQPVNLTSLYSLKVRNDSVFSYLPYFGRAYVAPMDPMRGGFIFELPLKNYSKEYSSKKGYQIHFEAKDMEDNYIFNVEISPEGYSSIGVTCYKRSFIRFSGQMVK